MSRKLLSWIIFNVTVAIVYIIAMDITIEIFNLEKTIALIALPSGIILATVFIFGKNSLVGIISGSIFGLIYTIYQLNLSLSLTTTILSSIVLAIVNSTQYLTAHYLIKKFTKHQHIFAHLQSVWVFIVVIMFSCLISATIIISSFSWLNLLQLEEYSISFLIWWLSNTLAFLLITPSIIIYHEKDILKINATIWETTLVLLLLLINYIIICRFAYPLEYLLLLVLIWSVFRLSRFYSSLFIIFLSIITIIATVNNYGIFIKKTFQESLLFLEYFNVVLSITTLILTAILSEKEESQLILKHTLDQLENKVQERTQELKETQIHLQEVNQSLSQMVDTDGLTMIANRRCFDRTLQEQWNTLTITKQYLSILLVDVDYFKLYNDAYGHLIGDECLKKVASALKKSCNRSSDLVARYGGEEFVILLSDTNTQGAIVVAQRIQSAIYNLQIEHKKSTIAPYLTTSIGISSIIPRTEITPETLIEQADKALYKSKEKGRNQFTS